MSVLTTGEMEKKVKEEYAAFLDQTDISYMNNSNGFYVSIPLKNIKESFTQICGYPDGKVLVTDYCGECGTGIRLAKQVAKAIQQQYRDCRIAVEHYGGAFEIDIYHEVEYTTAAALHEHVVYVAHIADEGFRIGKEMLGERFFK